ncbi:MAG TPA: AbrB/MazE/SpoVT family DNA-binding domain-containing protein [Thermomicrobiales bacterium]|nr:AbrB/MazE/SpoVT family DNA-binding domain-containing protein [Thermomicrobiales bacterium]
MSNNAGTATFQVYRAKVTGRHAVTLPAELCRQLNIETGDRVEFEIIGEKALLRRASDAAVPPARGLLRDYFASREDVQRFIEEERSGWEDDEEIAEE